MVLPAPVTVLGGTGFLGRAVVTRLLQEGVAVRVAARHPRRWPGASGADVEPVQADIRDDTSIASALAGSRSAVNCVGLYVEGAGQTFQAVHVEGAKRVARLAASEGLERLVHVSGIGADAHSPSAYVRARAKGEEAVRDAFGPATIIRPSVLFGPDDAFLTTLARMVRMSPVVPLFGRGETRLQPVYVEDVAAAATASLERAESAGGTFELGGGEVLSYREVIERVARHLGKHPVLLPVPFAAYSALAKGMGVLPSPPLTADQVELMRRDNVAAGPGFAELGISPRGFTEMLDACLG